MVLSRRSPLKDEGLSSQPIRTGVRHHMLNDVNLGPTRYSKTGRTAQSLPQVKVAKRTMNGVTVVDLFAGAGGLSLGASLAGMKVRVMVELDPTACETLRMNSQFHRGIVLQSDVSNIRGEELRERAGLTRSDPLIVVGGPPCQPFSKAAYWLEPGREAAYRRAKARGDNVRRPSAVGSARRDPRRSLVREFLRLVVESRADGFVFENVPSILHPRNIATMQSLTIAAENAGFQCLLAKADAVEFGVPQHRERVFLLGARGAKPYFPHTTHSRDSRSTLFTHSATTAGEALASFACKRFFEREEVVTGKWAIHLRGIPPGWNYKWHTAWAGHRSPAFVAETRFWNFLLKLDPNRPSWTVPANPGPWTGPFHWESRRLRIPELAALQSFPSSYKFAGTRRDQVRQIGNAVPPPLAANMIRQVFVAIERKRPRTLVSTGRGLAK